MKKGLMASFMVALMLITVISSVSSKDISVSDNNNEVEPAEDYQEIITFIDGSCNDYLWSRKYIIFKDVVFCSGSFGTTLNIHGWRKPDWERFNEKDVYYIHAPLFYGEVELVCYPVYTVDGIAIGNIEWSE